MKKALNSLVFVLSLSAAAHAQKSGVFTTIDGAIRGYDPVAYFNEHKPTKGDKKYSLAWNSATWYFVNQQNQDLFKQNPNKYAPQYGGYCAYGLADGHKAPTDPQAWTIVDNKLYLNYSKDVQQSWKKNDTGYIIKANKLWPLLKDKE